MSGWFAAVAHRFAARAPWRRSEIVWRRRGRIAWMSGKSSLADSGEPAVTSRLDDLKAWLAAREAIGRIVAERGVRLYDTRDRAIVISTQRSSEKLVVSNAADGDAAVRTGLAIEVTLTYLPEDDVRPVALVYFVEAVLSGGSREGAVLDADGAWVGTTWEVHSPYGSWGGQDEGKERIAWRPPPVW